MPTPLSTDDDDFYRALALAAATALTLYLLYALSPSASTEGYISSTASAPLQSLRHIWPTTPPRERSRVMKVTSLYGDGLKENELYEQAVRSHDEHNALFGYEMRMQRETVANTRASGLAFLLSVLVQELGKAEEERVEWLMWFNPDTILLNPLIPLETFLPPSDFPQTQLISTHDPDRRVDPGVFILRVSDWSSRLLLSALAPPREPGVDVLKAYDPGRLGELLAGEEFREGVVFHPREWWNGYAIDGEKFEGEEGRLLVHFRGLRGDKWRVMAETLERLRDEENTEEWRMEVGETGYEEGIVAFWERMRESMDLLREANGKEEEGVRAAVRRLGWTRDYESDLEDKMREAMDGLREALESGASA